MTVHISPPTAETCQAQTGRSQADVLSLVSVSDSWRPNRMEARAGQVEAAPATASDGVPPAIDITSLLGRCLGNIDLIVRVLSSFRNAGRADFERLQHAVQRLDFDTVVEVAHRFKGAAGNVSAPGLRRIAMSMERLGRDRNGMALELALTQLRSEWDEFVRCADTVMPAASNPAPGPGGASA